ncbi:MAG: hypothetical protein IPH57_08960 [Saprospiraceae bacterium]|nr:hypothetical protein [Saprospiraceae bacterium]
MLVKIKNNFIRQWKFVSVLLILIALYNSASAQFNSEIGYTASFMPAKSVNLIIDNYNKNQEMIEEMKDFKYISGFNAGLSYKAGLMRFGAFWESQTAKKMGTEGNLIGNIPGVEKKLYFYFNSVSGGLALIKDHVGIGTTVDYNFFRLKTNKSGVSNRVDVIKENYMSSKAYLIFYLRVNNKLGVELKPYARFPWNKVDLYPLSDYLNIERQADFQFSDFIQYGISFNILNGKQGD